MGVDIRDTMFGYHPHRMTLILCHSYDTGAQQTVVHIQQLLPARLRIIDATARHRTLPDESATVFQHTNGSGCGLRLSRHVGDCYIRHLAIHGVDQGIIGRVSSYQPTLLDPSHRRHEVLIEVRVIGIPGLELARLTVQPLYATAQRTDPDVTPLILCHRPDIVIQQAFVGTRDQIVGHAAIRINLNQTAVISTKPEGAVV